MSNKNEKLVVGFETNCVPDLNDLLDDAREDHFDFVSVPLVHPRRRRDAHGVSATRTEPLTRSDFLLDSRQWSTLIVGKIAEWIDLDSQCEDTAWASELAFKEDVAWASHLSLAAVIAPSPKPGGCANYSRCLNQTVQELTHMQVWLRVPLIYPHASASEAEEEEGTAVVKMETEEVGGEETPPIGDTSALPSGGAAAPAAAPAPPAHEAANGDTPPPPPPPPVVAAATASAPPGEGGETQCQPPLPSGHGAAGGSGGEGGGPPRAGAGVVGSESGGLGAAGIEDPWETWNAMRIMCEHKSCLAVVLEVTADLPGPAALERWVGEPVRAVVVPTWVFLTNKKGFPTLSRRHQAFLIKLIKLKVQFLLKGRANHPSGYLPYLQYLEHLRTRRPPPKEHETWESPYLDYLQAPLQPLMDNLESQTYEIFEKDPVKYLQYRRAVVAALGDLSKDVETVVLMVVGAGRGPLVKASLEAGQEAGRPLKMYAVEKNPNAVVTLRGRAAMEEWDNVTIVPGDMRQWDPPEKAHILVSELLGSWGDNELSPECLDGAQRLLREGGVSIPQEYTSYVAPMSSHKLWREVKNFEDLKRLETAYVVKLNNYLQLAEEQACFFFSHPNPDLRSTVNNKRYKTLRFRVEQASTLHGFAGFFDSRLYGDIRISIVPSTFSEGMFSWFPLYIPLREPVVLRAGEVVEAHFWRCTSPTKVWYEWALASPQPSPVHNPNGRSYWIGL